MIGLKLEQVSFSYNNGLVLKGLDLYVKAGEMFGLLGPNGSGKTTLIKLASGILSPVKGKVEMDDRCMGQLSRKVIAQTLAVVPQQFSIPFAFTAREVVTLGRIPFIKGMAGETETDLKAVAQAMEMVGVEKFALRRFDELSGGERQKVILAMALAQQPQLLLLDEPTVHLDISQQVEILELVRKLNKEQGITVLAAMHDLNLASLYFDRLVLLKQGMVCAEGSPSEVLTEERIRDVFAASVRVESNPATGLPQVLVVPGHNGNGKKPG
jgi:iron complex transport system ATP-binding protein